MNLPSQSVAPLAWSTGQSRNGLRSDQLLANESTPRSGQFAPDLADPSRRQTKLRRSGAGRFAASQKPDDSPQSDGQRSQPGPEIEFCPRDVKRPEVAVLHQDFLPTVFDLVVMIESL